MKIGMLLVFLALSISSFGQTADEVIAKNLAARGGVDGPVNASAFQKGPK